ncbi:rhomboid family intramembrane serine protease [Rhodococcus sp. HNM0569]|uniref:rhomboid family intramembrane serine protease n=1 Tax=Rhodococcus sp. HNM0569 TaxID=2716340 RepID=UPI00146B045B|nr:rhomboid family intramembrane serine protease [Rhodococcus sp. HNM0569]NLU84698.1 rhomboid family intramembrane serine protease [Rhodococcus sp. HNM0569]
MSNPGWGGNPNEGALPQPRCVRHPDRPTALACTRCGRPACPDCLRSAAVGYQCVDCVAEGQKSVRQARTVSGATMASQQKVPLVTYVLMALNIGVFLVTALQSRDLMQNQLGSKLFVDWVLYGPAVADGQWIRVLGSGFLHFGLMHLAVNMLALWIIGRDVELVLGRSRYTALYLTSLIGGSASVMVFEPYATTAGASGAVFGLMGALAVILVRLRRSPGPIIAVIVLNIVISVTVPGISLWGHMGGLVAGALAAVGLLYVPQWMRATQRTAAVIGWVSLAVVAVFAFAVVGLRVVQLREQFGLG